ncbi:MAG: SDR family NAD(P)-dependent oxidoreductase [Anaerolineae bacterium]
MKDEALAGKVAIVTGAGQGIGAAIARALAAAGVKVAVNDINPDRAERVAAEIEESGGTAVGIMADVSNKFQCSHLIDTARRRWGRLDILVNNAAIRPQSAILKTDEYEWQRALDVNLKGVFFMSQLCGRVMKDENQERGGGVIVNVGSTAGATEPLAGRGAYCASKAGVVGFARECAREFAGYGIRVNTALPGEGDGERPYSPEDVADVVLFLCSDGSRSMTGSVVTVGGGFAR